MDWISDAAQDEKFSGDLNLVDFAKSSDGHHFGHAGVQWSNDEFGPICHGFTDYHCILRVPGYSAQFNIAIVDTGLRGQLPDLEILASHADD